MKRKPIFLIGLIVVFILNACENSNGLKEDTTEILLTELTHTHETQDHGNGIDLFIELRDTLIGKFDGINLDTLIIEPLNSWKPDDKESNIPWHIYTKQGTVKELEFESFAGCYFELIPEGDLDGNGKDEFGLLPYHPTSIWSSYHVYKNINGKWMEMISAPQIYLPHLNDLPIEEWVQPSKGMGFVNVKHSEMNEDATEFTIVDSIVKIIK